MDDLVKQAKALEASVVSQASGAKSQELLAILDQFHSVLAESSSAKVSMVDSNTQISRAVVKSEKQTAVDLLEGIPVESPGEGNAEKELNALLKASVCYEEDPDYKDDLACDYEEATPDAVSGLEEMMCLLCESALNGEGSDGLTTLPSAPESSASSSSSSSKHTYISWKDFSQHIKDSHCGLDESRITNNGYVLKDGQIFSNSGKLIKNSRTVVKYSVLECPRCKALISATTSYKYGYLKLCHHLNTKHNISLPNYIQIYQCKDCSYSSPDEMLLARHVEYNHSGLKSKNNQKVTCTKCGKNVLQRFLARHMEVIHKLPSPAQAKSSVKTLTCEICSKEMAGQRNLENHIKRVHKKLKDFLCHICSGSFHENKDLVNHLYVKHDLNPQNKPVLQCQVVGCDFSTLTEYRMQRHNNAEHTSEKRCICPSCGKTFKTRHNLRQHEKIMHPSGPYEYTCTLCSFRSTSEQYLKRHMKIHSDVKKHKCSHCEYRSHFSENVKKHSRIHTESHVLKRKAKLDHNYIKRNQRSKSMREDPNTQLLQLQATHHIAEANTGQRVESLTPNIVYNYEGANGYYNTSMQLPTFQTAPVQHLTVNHLVPQLPGNHPLKPASVLHGSLKPMDQITDGQEMLTLSNSTGSETQSMYHQFDPSQISSNTTHYMSL